MVKSLLHFALLMLLMFAVESSAQQAEQVFEQYSPALVQIKSINIGSGQKSSIGTGFFIDQQGTIVTNYHVVSSYVQNPKKYRLAYSDQAEQSYSVTVLAVDVINDLALLKAEQSPNIQFNLAKQAPVKGENMFALGNPHDLGMIVVPGTYNGIKQNSFYQRIHFTGAINPGMSGGPAVDQDGLVVGVNVATAGNQIGFLVPVAKLWTLIEQWQQLSTANELLNKEEDNQVTATKPTLIEQIRSQLIANQQALYSQLLSSEWQLGQLGDAQVPNEIAKVMPCWGDSNNQKNKVLHSQVSTNCSLGESVYLSSQHSTGFAQVGFSWLQSDTLSPMQLSQLYQLHLNNRYGKNNAGADDVSNFHCAENLVENQLNTKIKGITCVRAYRKYPDLYDVKFKSVLLGKADQALVAKYVLQGVTEETANAFYQKFVEQVSWQ